MAMERGQFPPWAQAHPLQAGTETISAAAKPNAPIRFVLVLRRRAIGEATACPIARASLLARLAGMGNALVDRARWFNWARRAPPAAPQSPFRGSNAALPDGAGKAYCARYFQARVLAPPDAPSPGPRDCRTPP